MLTVAFLAGMWVKPLPQLSIDLSLLTESNHSLMITSQAYYRCTKEAIAFGVGFEPTYAKLTAWCFTNSANQTLSSSFKVFVFFTLKRWNLTTDLFKDAQPFLYSLVKEHLYFLFCGAKILKKSHITKIINCF